MFLVTCCAFLLVVSKSADGYYIPEADMTVPQLAEYFGYPMDVFHPQTSDGYILTLHRIPYGKSGPTKAPRPVVFLQHGLLGSSADWATNFPWQSAAYFFADAGFDVWLGNVRGNVYTQTHATLSPSSEAFWNFSIDEMAAHDLPCLIGTALNVSKASQLYYVGHSQGTTLFFAHAATQPQAASGQVAAFFGLAPVSTVSKIKGLFGYLGRKFGNFTSLFIKAFGSHDFMPNDFFTKLFATVICGTQIANPLCEDILFLIAGPNTHNLNATHIPVYLAHTPAGTSSKNVAHWSQLAASGAFRKYDYGSDNPKKYNSTTPPSYNLTSVTVPTYLYYSDDDWLADSVDVQKLISALQPGILRATTHVPDYNHMDYIWGMHAAGKIYQPIIRTIQKLERLKKNKP